MDAATIGLVLAVVGVNFGWQPVSDGPAGYEYIVQIEPEIAELMGGGESVPIVSHVPPEVAPIRRVRVVVGRGEVGRTALAGDSAKLEKYVARDVGAGSPPPGRSSVRDEAVIVRGQSPDDRYGITPQANPPQVDRYGNPISDPARGASQPGLLGRVENAVSETASALRDGLEAGFQEANEQIPRAGQAVGVAGSGSPAPGTTGEPAAGRTGEPPVATGGGLPIAGSAIAQTPSGWTSIGGSVAAPPVWSPPLLATGAARGGDSLVMQTGGGPTFPLPGADGREPLLTIQGSELAAPPGVPSVPPWNDPISVSADGDSSDSVPVRPVAPRVPEPQPAQASPSDVAETETAAPPSAHDVGAVPVLDGTGEPPVATAGREEASRVEGVGGGGEPVPWRPLLFTSLGLVGSLGANLFLGWSYLDARQRYRALVRKTAESFRRKTRRGE